MERVHEKRNQQAGKERERRRGCETKSDRERARRENADGHVSMGARERFGVRESCIIVAGQ